ncbi:MAG: CRISPR system precrRNA processing endoribonuclease RAMP protein Cas6 [Thermodesulfovibrionales bacterium]|nr:CRISPR system precrRNA processing endoribonuclease RAMP protein Cas6 [Thermodesulfovibrionales bacterium]
MLEAFRLAHYRFTLIPETIIRMPEFNKGTVLRGAFGSSLRRLVCSMNKGISCDSCILKEKCAYILIFNPVGINPARRLQNVPRGYILKPPLEEEIEYSSNMPISFEMVLVGDRINYLPYVIVPIIELGKVGIGLNRGRFILRNISIIKNGISESIYDSESNTVKNIHKLITGSELIEYAKKINQHRITLHFLTPTRIKYNPTGEKGKSEVVRIPEFHHFIRRLRDRINALSATYCGGPINVDFKGIAEKAMAIKTREVNLRWIDIKRKRKTQPIQHDQSGFMGKITFEGALTEFLPLIVLGEYVHVGEDAVFGNGWYRY